MYTRVCLGRARKQYTHVGEFKCYCHCENNEGGVVHLVNKDTEEGEALLVGVRVKLRLDLDDERRSDGGEQTSLQHKSGKVYPSVAYGVQILVLCSDHRRASS